MSKRHSKAVVSFRRGHPVYRSGNRWLYMDNSFPYDPDRPRPCPRCGKLPDQAGIDACLGGYIPGVVSACCGHGVFRALYII